MVINSTINKIIRRLEKYLIAKANYRLGNNYDLILVVPSESQYLEKYTWLISAKILDSMPQHIFIEEMMHGFKEILSYEEFSSVSRISKLDSQHPFVKNLNFVFAFTKESIEVTDISIGGINIEKGILIRSHILDRLKENNAVTIILNNGDRINAGIISINREFNIKHYTGKGLRELFSPDLDSEAKRRAKEILTNGDDFLLQNHYLAFTKLDDIETIY